MLADFEQKIKSKAIPITDIAIDKIPCTRIFCITEYNRKIQELHKYLLREAQKLNSETKKKAVLHAKKAEGNKKRLIFNYLRKIKNANLIEKEKIYEEVCSNIELADKDKMSIILSDNDLMEVGILVDIPNISHIDLMRDSFGFWVIKGKTPRRVNMKDNKDADEAIESFSKNRLLFMHNHPSGATFSGEDLKMFWSHDSVHTITAIGNNGCIYLLQKGINFDKNELAQAYYDKTKEYSDKPNNATLAVNYILKNADNYNMIYRKGYEKK